MKGNWFTRLLNLILYWWNRIFGPRSPHPPREIQIKDLDPADILLFSADKDSWISQAIAFLTDGPVSHSAIMYSHPDTLVHGVLDHVQEGSMTQLFKKRAISVMQLARKQPTSDLNPVLEAAAEYVKNKEPFPMSTMYLLAVILVYRRFAPDDETQKWMTLILRKVIVEIEEFIRRTKYPGKLPMVCSQFVYQCFKKGNVPLEIKNGVILEAVDEKRGADQNLLEAALALSPESISKSVSKVPKEDAINDEELARLLLESLQSSEKRASRAFSNDLLLEANRFGIAVHAVISGDASISTEGDLYPLSERALMSAAMGLRYLQENKAMFVLPVDFLQNCPTLEFKGLIKG